MYGAEVLFNEALAPRVRQLMIEATGGCACAEGKPCALLDLGMPELRNPEPAGLVTLPVLPQAG